MFPILVSADAIKNGDEHEIGSGHMICLCTSHRPIHDVSMHILDALHPFVVPFDNIKAFKKVMSPTLG
jgi:hypothetical protein